MANFTRKLAAIIFTDIVGFTKLSSENKPAALALLETQRDLLKPVVDKYKLIRVGGQSRLRSIT